MISPLFAHMRHSIAVLALSTALITLSGRADAQSWDPAPSASLLVQAARAGDTLPQRGRAIAAIAQLDDPELDGVLAQLQSDPEALVQIWATAALLQRAPDLQALYVRIEDSRAWCQRTSLDACTSLQRPIQIRAAQLVAQETDQDASALIMLSLRSPQLKSLVDASLRVVPLDELLQVALASPDGRIRYQASAYLGARDEPQEVIAAALIRQLQIDATSSTVPWQGGPLYVPSLQWSSMPEQARALLSLLGGWRLLCIQTDDRTSLGQLQNNMASVGLLRAAGQPNLSDDALLRYYRTSHGSTAARRLSAAMTHARSHTSI